MRTVLRIGSSLVKLMTPGETLRTFRDAGSASAFLGRMFADPSDYARIRRFLEQHGALDQTREYTDAELLDRFAAMILGGNAQIVSGRTRPSEPAAIVFETEPDPVVEDAPPEKEAELTWVEIELLDTNGDPLRDEPFEITLPDGGTKSGKLDTLGRARFESIEPGRCKVTFPKLDELPRKTA